MSNVLVIIPCGQGKIWNKQPEIGPVRARDAYTGAPFVVNKAYAEHFSNYWLILSAKYGFVSPDFLIPGPYDVTFKKQSTNPVSVSVLWDQIKSQSLDGFDRIIALGGIEYRTIIKQAFAGYNVRIYFPFAGLSLGYGMQATRKAIESNDSGVRDDNCIQCSLGETLTVKETIVAKNHIDKIYSPTGVVELGDLPNIEVIWTRIKNHQREAFQQIRGGKFTYVVKGNAVLPDRTNIQISKAHLEEALVHYPLTSTVKIQHLRGPSYIYAILMDKRIY